MCTFMSPTSNAFSMMRSSSSLEPSRLTIWCAPGTTIFVWTCAGLSAIYPSSLRGTKPPGDHARHVGGPLKRPVGYRFEVVAERAMLVTC